MKKFKSGFTLAEVLITLAIIGVVAAIVMPSVMSNYQYKSVGVKLGKFMSTVEASTRPFVVNNGNFSAATDLPDVDVDGRQTEARMSNVRLFLNESFMYKTFNPVTTAGEGAKTIVGYPELGRRVYEDYVAEFNLFSNPIAENPVATLKDGTSIQVFLDDTEYDGAHENLIPVEKFGTPVFRFSFNPAVQGLPTNAHRLFQFSVTDLGYLFPHENDDCLWTLYNNNFDTNSRSFAANSACYTATTGGESGT